MAGFYERGLLRRDVTAKRSREWWKGQGIRSVRLKDGPFPGRTWLIPLSGSIIIEVECGGIRWLGTYDCLGKWQGSAEPVVTKAKTKRTRVK